MKKIKNFLIIFCCFVFIILIFKYNEIIYDNIMFSFSLFKTKIFPNLFPFLVISGILINYNFVYICSKFFSNLFNKLFKISGPTSYIFIMSLLTGFPSNAKYTRELYDKNLINEKEANKILMFTHFSNPLFIIGTISYFINKKIAFLVLISHYLGNILIGVFFRNYNVIINNKKMEKIKSKSFGACLSNSITDSLNILILIFGTITSFLIISSIIKSILNLNSFSNIILSGLLEFTQGITAASGIVNIKLKAILMLSFISFGGISVHMQVLSIISNSKIKYYPFLFARVIHVIISDFILYLLI